MLQLIEQAPYASIGKIWLTRTEYVLLFALLVMIFCWGYYKRPVLLKAVFIGAFVLSVCLSFKRIDSMRTNTITFFSLKKQPVILFKQGGEAVLVTDMADTDKAYRYSIRPCLDSSRLTKLNIIPFKKDTITAFFRKQGRLMRFLNTDVLVIDKTTQLNRLNAPVNIGYAFITGSPKALIPIIVNRFVNSHLVIAADNSDRFLDSIKASGKNNDKKMYILKRNKSLVLQSE